MENNVKAEVARHPYISAVADLLSAEGHPDSTLFDLRDELLQSLEVVNKIIERFGQDVKLTNDTSPPIR